MYKSGPMIDIGINWNYISYFYTRTKKRTKGRLRMSRPPSLNILAPIFWFEKGDVRSAAWISFVQAFCLTLDLKLHPTLSQVLHHPESIVYKPNINWDISFKPCCGKGSASFHQHDAYGILWIDFSIYCVGIIGLYINLNLTTVHRRISSITCKLFTKSSFFG